MKKKKIKGKLQLAVRDKVRKAVPKILKERI